MAIRNNVPYRPIEETGKSSENKKEEAIKNIRELLEAYENESAIFEVVTDKYVSLYEFIGDSTLIATGEGYPFYFDGKHIIQFFTDNKVIQTEFKDGKIGDYDLMIEKRKSELSEIIDWLEVLVDYLNGNNQSKKAHETLTKIIEAYKIR